MDDEDLPTAESKYDAIKSRPMAGTGNCSAKGTPVQVTTNQSPVKDITACAQTANDSTEGNPVKDAHVTAESLPIIDVLKVRPTIDTTIDYTSVNGHSKPEMTTSKPPLAFCKLIVKRPKFAFAVTLCSHLMLLVWTVILTAGGYDVLPVDFAGVPLDLTNDEYFLRGEAWVNADSDPSIYPDPRTTLGQLQERFYTSESLQLFFEGSNVFTKPNLKAIADLENVLLGIQEFGDFCQLTSLKQCRPPQSIIRLFDGTYSSLDPIFRDPSFNNIGNVLNAAVANRKLSSSLQLFLGKDFTVDNSTNTASSSITRSVFYFGTPLNGSTTTDDDDNEQSKKLQAFLVKHFRDKLYGLVDDGYSGMDFVFFSRSLFSNDIITQVTADLMLAGGSFAFIFIFMLIQTQSLFITSFAVLSILTSFTGANLIYRIILDYRYLGVFHVLSVFIILGIGADDIFVYYDAWRATSHKVYPSLEHRVSDCYRRTSLTMFFTSLTTMCAFFVNAFSPLLAVASFGLFSGLLVLVNYLSVITFFPCVVVLFHLNWEQWTWPCFRLCSNAASDAKMDVLDSKYDSRETESIYMTREKLKVKTYNPLVRFCRGPYFKFITHKVVRWCTIAVFIANLTLFVYFASKLTADTESMQIFKNDHNYERA